MYKEMKSSSEILVVKNFFALESLDGVGKSTAILGLKDRGFVVFRTPPEEISNEREKYDFTPLKDRFLYYLKGVEMVGQKAKIAQNGQSQFSDRFLLSTVATHQAMGLLESDVENEVFSRPELVLPQMTILLTASDEVRMARLMGRGTNKHDLENLKINDHVFKGFKDWAGKLNHPLVEIDTSNLNPDEVVEAILKETK